MGRGCFGELLRLILDVEKWNTSEWEFTESQKKKKGELSILNW